jgi:hypothetical protein
MSEARRRQREWIEHQYFRTYQVADLAEAVASESFAYMGGLLQDFVAEDQLVSFVAPWQTRSALHRFAAFIAEELFYGDLTGPQLITVDSSVWPPRRILPVDRALQIYCISDEPFFPEPALADEEQGSAALQNAYYEYFRDLRLSGA